MPAHRLFEVDQVYQVHAAGRTRQLVVVSPPGTILEGMPIGSTIQLRRSGEGAAQRRVTEIEIHPNGSVALMLERERDDLSVRGGCGWEVWTSVERASARRLDLFEETARSLSIDLTGVGGFRWGREWWLLAQVLPSFHPDAVLGLLNDGQSSRGIFVVRPAEAATWSPPTPVEASQSLEGFRRTVESIVISPEEPPRGAWLDGIGYRVELASGHLDARFHFFNPSRPDLVALERALFQAGTSIAETQGAAAEREYLAVWRGYLSQDGGSDGL